MKTVRKVFCTDTPRRVMHDEILSALPPGKCLALGRVWTGELRSAVDATLEAMAPLTTGLTSGRVLHAEPSSASLDLGQRWLGELRSKVLDAVRNYRAGGKDDAIDLRPVAAGIRDLSEALTSGDVTSLAWASDGLRRARDFLDSAAKHRTGDAGEWLTTSDAQSRLAVDRINAANRTFWNGRTSPAAAHDAYRAPQGVSPQTTEMRNQVAAANRAMSMPEKIGALNSAAKAFWAARG